jgi:hypothetical protein
MNTPIPTGAQFEESKATRYGAIGRPSPKCAEATPQYASRAAGRPSSTSARPDAPPLMSHTELRNLLHRAGYTATQAQEIIRGLPDPINFDRDGGALFSGGVSLDRLIDRLGGSP